MEVSVGEAHAEQYPSKPVSERKLPTHLVALEENEWALWRWAGLRSAGFPAREVLGLADSACAAVADELLDREWQAVLLRRQAVESMLQELGRETDSEQHTKLNRAIRRLQKGKPVEDYEGSPETARELEQFTAAFKKVEESRSKHADAYKAATEGVSRRIHEIISGNRFQRAIIWQNRSAFDSGIKSLLAKSLDKVGRDSKQRHREELVAAYLQRYCLKNDTIGFFGPVGWARLVPDSVSIEVKPGQDLLAASRVYIESWCLDALAESIAKNKMLRPWFAPRRAPSMYLDGEKLLMPGSSTINLGAKHATVLNACDGEMPARELAARIISSGVSGFQDENEIFEVLDWMQRRGMISWTLSLPIEIGAENRLKAILEAIDDEELRRGAIGKYLEIESAIDTVRQSVANADQLYSALAQLEETFSKATGVAATRAAGETYAGRTLVYEDCRRDIDVSIGSGLLEELRGPLALLLTSARWFTWEVAQLMRGLLERIYFDLARAANTRTVDFLSLWTRAIDPLLLSQKQQLLDPLADKLQKKWEDLLDIGSDLKHVEYKSEDLRKKVRNAFAAPRPGWKFARYHSPDLMIAAASVEAIQRGEYQLVLGEIHIGTHTMRNSFFVAQHPSPEDLFEAIDIDFPQSRVIPVLPKHWGATSTSRTTIALVSPKDFWLDVALDSPSAAPKSQVLTLGELVVEEADAGLQVRTRDERLSFDIVEFFGEMLSSRVINCLRLDVPGRHTPRISFDRLVVARESWRFSGSELAFAKIKDDVERFVQARKWAHGFGIPRFAFVRVPVEIKPFYVDFDSPLYVDILAKMVRRTLEASDSKGDEILVREMLPGTDMLWLPDAEGQRYTSEFRVVAVDLAN